MANQVKETRTTVTNDDAPTPVVADGRSPGNLLAERIVNYIFGVLLALLALRFVLSLLGANRGNAFADFIYDTSALFAAPFFGLFNYTTTYGAARFEFETLIAMFVYILLGVGIVALIRLPRNDT